MGTNMHIYKLQRAPGAPRPIPEGYQGHLNLIYIERNEGHIHRSKLEGYQGEPRYF